MKVYREFHGEIRKENIGKVLRSIVKTEKDNFKIGYVSQENQINIYNKYDKISNIFVSYIKDSNKIVRSKLYSIREFNIEKAINYFSEID